MRFRRQARLDASQIDDQRGRRLGRRGSLALGGAGGLIGVVLVVVMALAGGGGDGSVAELGPELEQLLNQTAGGSATEVPSTLAQDCQTGADANEREDCRIVAVVNSVQAWWQEEFERSGQAYQLARTQFFAEQTSTGCGAASSAVSNLVSRSNLRR